MTKYVVVCGCPRSGTTAFAAHLLASSNVLDLGEYYAFYFSQARAPFHFRRIPSPVKSAYLQSLFGHAAQFVLDLLVENEADRAIDSTPWHLLSLDELQASFSPGQVLPIVMLRSPSALISSLRRSYADGYEWAGPTDSERNTMIAEFLTASLRVRGGSIFISFDHFRQDPEAVLTRVDTMLDAAGIGHGRGETFAVGHASGSAKRPVACKISSDGSLKWIGVTDNPVVGTSPEVDELWAAVKERYATAIAVGCEWVGGPPASPTLV